MTFLAPLFLAGLLAIGVPVIVHLTNRPKREAMPFPSLMFLQQVPFRSVRRQRIRHWWLLAIRAALVVLLVAAFARPLLTRWGGTAGALTAGQDVVILLDNSYSMRYRDRWQRALSAARGVVTGLGPEDRATIVVFGDQAASLGQSTGDHATLLAALANAAPGYGTTRYAAGLQAAHDILEPSTLPRRRLVLISDFQRAGWRPDEAVHVPAGTVVEARNLSQDAGNVEVTDLIVERAVQGQREAATISAQVVNRGRTARRGLRVTLEVDGRTVQTRTVNLGPQGVTAAMFAPFPLSDRAAQVAVRADPDDLPVDDAQYAIVAPGDVIRVRLISQGGGARGAAFLRQALEVGGSPRFQVLSGSGLPDYQVAILADVPPGSAALAAGMADLVRRGGGMLVLLGEQSGGAWPKGWRDLMGGVPGGAVEPAASSGTTLAGLRYDHPVFAPFSAPKSGDFGAARVYRYRRFDPDSGTTVLARFDDGAPALVEHRVGQGRVLVWTTPMDNLWSDLPVQPVFLPLVHQMMRYLAGYAARRTAFPVGYVLDLQAARELAGGASDLTVESPAGRRTALGAAAEPAMVLDTPGFYAVRTVGGSPKAVFLAVNLNPSEGDLAPLDLDAVLAAIGPAGGAAAVSPESATLTSAERERRQGFWWYLVVGAVTMALAETLLSNRLPAIGRAGSTS